MAKSAVYGTVDLCTWGRGISRSICGETIRFPTRWSRWYASDYEPRTFAFLKDHCSVGDTVLDIGAHFGLFSVVMAKLVGSSGRVISFEPTLLSREVLSQTVHLNGVSSIVEIRSEAVSNRTGTSFFHDTGSVASNANSLVKTEWSHQAATVETVHLDGFVGERRLSPRCIKIDVEGAELDLLRGARSTFLDHRPAVALSLHPAALQAAGQSLTDVWQVLQEYEMSVRLLEDYGADDGLNGIDKVWFCRKQQVFDVAALPREHASLQERR